MIPETQRVERVIAMAERLIEALEADIEALKAGKARNLRTSDPEIQRLTALYARDAAGIDARTARAIPAVMQTRLVKSTSRIRDTLQRHSRIVHRVKNASEGLVRAVAEEVDRRRAPLRTYQRTPTAAPHRRDALIYNRVV